ncbi:hypothetical protein RPQ02_01050 [Streptomyces sp. AM2-3-1]|uniref:hypothetical protein n=2 Tax=Streptomyces TaxID=1883 RepID=UPI0028C43E74|nr:hypothetical protein [Streptomyces sp. AM2-3-1]WNO62480.1 hypothetical protein RPQ02_01050 [Streptomyces sp. AM2-3-1]
MAVFNPSRRLLRGQAHLLLAGMLLLFGDEFALKDFRRYAHGAPKRPKDQRTEVVPLDFCACEVPDLIAKIEGREYPARPSDSFGPAAALYFAQCQVCGGAYKLPWRRSLSAGEPDGTAALGCRRSGLPSARGSDGTRLPVPSAGQPPGGHRPPPQQVHGAAAVIGSMPDSSARFGRCPVG